MPPIQEHYVKIQKYNKNRSWYYPSIKKEFLFVELTNLAHLPMSKAFELNILKDKKILQNFQFQLINTFIILVLQKLKLLLTEKLNKNLIQVTQSISNQI